MKFIQSGRSRLRMLAALGAAIVTMGFGVSTTQAAWVLQDNLESNPAAWQFGNAGSGGGYLLTTASYARSPNNSAYVYAWSGFSSAGRTVVLSPYFAGRTLYTTAAIYLSVFGTNVTVNFEVIDPSTWTYIALKTVTLNGSGYQRVVTDRFIPNRPDVYVRVSVLAGTTGFVGVVADDLTVTADATPAYEPAFWNNNAYIKANNNCYNYSNNHRTDTFAQPGKASGRQYIYPPTGPDVSAAAIRDGLVATNAWAAAPNGQTKIALVIAPGWDYHWYRQDSNGLWSHKPGGTSATNVDNSGALIYNPETANRGPYTQFIGYFFTPSDPIQGQGHANIN